MGHVAKIAVSAATFTIDKPYDYAVPHDLQDLVVPGMRVLVPFGKGNRKSEGVVLSLGTDSNKKLKSIEKLLDDAAVLSEESLRLALWMSDRFFCTVFDAFRAMLPAEMWFKDGVMRQADKTAKIAVLTITAEEADALAKQKKERSVRQSEVLALLSATSAMAVKDICSITGSTSSVINTLEKKGIISIEHQEVFRRPEIRILKNSDPIILSSQQQAAFDSLVPLLSSDKPEAALLYGVTGSGKTSVYLRLIEKALEMGKNAIVLVPEIALTPQTVSIFASYFGDAVAVLHSALGTGERFDEWKRIRSGTVRVVVGTRSAVFAPLSDIGLIVIDEEQEHTYKSENNPRYHAREIAKYRVTHNNGLLLLASATPSIESMYNAKIGKYHLFRLDGRYNKKDLPDVRIVDMREELKNGNGGSISSALFSEINKNISNNEQSILFINRRGTNPLVACGECGYTFRCGKCTVNMTFHALNNRLLCHYCGDFISLPSECPDCAGKLKFVGAGTQKIEAELQELFPNVSILRMDADTVTRINSHDKLLGFFREGKAQILLGTQMVTKGLDFENVTLVGVLSADTSLYMSDYRAHERTFSLITQVVGRSGRGKKAGRAIIQTLTPGHDVIKLASKQDYNEFFEREIVFRQALSSPPINDLLTITAVGLDETAVMRVCAKIHAMLSGYFLTQSSIKLLGPAPAPIPKVNNKYRFRLLVCCENKRKVRDTIAHTIREIMRDKNSRGINVYADADSYD